MLVNSRGIKKLPKKLSLGEETLALQLRAYNIHFDKEFKFHPTRKWRADFALGVEHGDVLIEVEGGVGNKSRHTSYRGYTNDCEKYNAAMHLGWKVLRFTTKQVTSGQAILQIVDMLKKEGKL